MASVTINCVIFGTTGVPEKKMRDKMSSVEPSVSWTESKAKPTVESDIDSATKSIVDSIKSNGDSAALTIVKSSNGPFPKTNETAGTIVNTGVSENVDDIGGNISLEHDGV